MVLAICPKKFSQVSLHSCKVATKLTLVLKLLLVLKALGSFPLNQGNIDKLVKLLTTTSIPTLNLTSQEKLATRVKIVLKELT